MKWNIMKWLDLPFGDDDVTMILSSLSHEIIWIYSLTKVGMWHFKTAVFSLITNSS